MRIYLILLTLLQHSHITTTWLPPSICYQCKKKYWSDYKCINITILKIPGLHRPCVECGKYNYDTAEYTCKPCSYQCQTCDQYGCLTCKSEYGFEYNSITKECLCLKGYFKDGRCFCHDALHYVNKEGECMPCGLESRGEGNCFPDCPINTFEYTTDKCAHCHYSCSRCSDPKVCMKQLYFLYQIYAHNKSAPN